MNIGFKQIIITADDYGMCPSVDTAIEECLAAGSVLSTCLLTNMSDLGRVKKLKQRFPNVSFGIHWNLTLGRPVLEPLLIPTLVNEKGYFFSLTELKNKVLTGKINKVDIQKELNAQYFQFHETLGEPDYWCTHENIHQWPFLFKIITGEAIKLNIFSMRNHSRIALKYNLRLFLKNKWFLKELSWAKLAGMLMPAGMLHFSNGNSDKTDIEKMLQNPWPSTHLPPEIIIHPAIRVEPELFGNLQESRVREYQYFSNPDVVKRLKKLGYSIVGYNSLIET